jgi:hypothetical protein
MASKHGQDKVASIKKELADSKRIKELEDLVLGLTNENEVLYKLVKDYQARFIKGGVNYIEHEGYVIGAVKIFPYSEYTYDQDINEAIGTARYNTTPFIKAVDRQLVIDKTKKARYDSI